jgi:hypothetical protein
MHSKWKVLLDWFYFVSICACGKVGIITAWLVSGSCIVYWANETVEKSDRMMMKVTEREKEVFYLVTLSGENPSFPEWHSLTRCVVVDILNNHGALGVKVFDCLALKLRGPQSFKTSGAIHLMTVSHCRRFEVRQHHCKNLETCYIVNCYGYVLLLADDWNTCM